MAGGRPTTYTEDMLEKAEAYASGRIPADELIPTVVGLCKAIGRSKSTVYGWKKDASKTEFLDILERIEENQHISLVNGGLGGTLNPTITKMMMTKHGYSDKAEIDHTTSDGSMSPSGSQLSDFYADSDK